MSRIVGAVLLASMLAIGGASAGAEEPWEHIWFTVPVDDKGAVNTVQLLKIAHVICQGLGGRHYRSGSSRLGPMTSDSLAQHGVVRQVFAACGAERENASKR